jgi:plasmid maintenance system antidote protein VapI
METPMADFAPTHPGEILMQAHYDAEVAREKLASELGAIEWIASTHSTRSSN